MSKASGIKAPLIADGNLGEQARQLPGAFYYVKGAEDRADSGIIHSCPCGCGNLGHLNLDPAGGRPLWTNSGSREAPTLAPSVGIKAYRDDQSVEADGFHWHGWLRNGTWESC